MFESILPHQKAEVWPPGGTLLVLTAGGSEEITETAGEEAVSAVDCIGEDTGVEGVEGVVMTGDTSESVVETFFLSSGPSSFAFIISLFSWTGFLSPSFLQFTSFSCLAGSGSVLAVSVLVTVSGVGRLCTIVSPVTGHTGKEIL